MKPMIAPTKENKEYTVYTEKVLTKDDKTGEVLKDTTVVITKAKKRDNFIKIFVDNIDFLGAGLNNAERQVLVGFLAKVDYQNVVYVHSELRKEICIKYNISPSTISNGIKGLVQKGVLLELTDGLKEKMDIHMNNGYLINPDIAGKGSFNELQKLRQEIYIDYDFEKLEIKKSYTAKSQYEGFDEITENMDKHEVKQIKQSNSPDGVTQKTEILIAEKEHVDAEVIVNDKLMENVNKENIQQIEPNDREKELLKLKIMQLENEKMQALIAQKDAEIARLEAEKKLRVIKNSNPSLFDDTDFDNKGQDKQ